MASTDTLLCTPIGFVRSPFTERSEAPRQAAQSQDARAAIELMPGRDFEHALHDLDQWSHVWILFWFHLNDGWRPKVLPPRSSRRRGVFATRAPHRPNPIGLSAVKLESIDGLRLTISGVDFLDGTPVLDIKPYVPYADCIAGAGSGWLETARDPGPRFEVEFGPEAEAALDYLREHWRIHLRAAIVRVLDLGPEPHPYRRIRSGADGSLLAIKDWRARFVCDTTRITVLEIRSGYGASQLLRTDDPTLEPHRAFTRRFPQGSDPSP